MDLKGKNAIVTGSAVGVGRETAIELAKRSANVAINYSRSRIEAQETVKIVGQLGVEVVSVQADVAVDDEVRRMVERTLEEFGSIDVLVNNAGMTNFVDFADLEGLSEEIWDRILAVNLKGPFFCSRAVAPAMKKAGQGIIVNVASTSGIRATGSSIAYAASKAGLINMTTALARTLAPEIRVNCVAPGFIDTRWLQRGLGDLREQFIQRTSEQTPLGRIATPEDVTQVILSFIESADFVTGQTMIIDGGYTVKD
jgi:3-oxoacyl-[acyl-carrier protein] reductase